MVQVEVDIEVRRTSGTRGTVRGISLRKSVFGRHESNGYNVGAVCAGCLDGMVVVERIGMGRQLCRRKRDGSCERIWIEVDGGARGVRVDSDCAELGCICERLLDWIRSVQDVLRRHRDVRLLLGELVATIPEEAGDGYCDEDKGADDGTCQCA
jgi:hypothetical protein